MHIVIEGQDATGKDVQGIKLAEYLREKYPGREVRVYSESGTNSEDDFVQKIAELTYKTAQPIDHRTRSLLYLINRYHQWKTIAEPTLAKDGIVITTRSWFSTLIYEGYHGGVPAEVVKKIHEEIMPKQYFQPDHIVILTLSDEERKKRIQQDSSRRTAEVFKAAEQKVQNEINAGYLRVAEEFNVPKLDTAGTIDEVFKKLIELFFGSGDVIE